MHDLFAQALQLRTQSQQLQDHAQQLREEMRIARYNAWQVRETSRRFREQLQQKQSSRLILPPINDNT
jgi:hypothetical protein